MKMSFNGIIKHYRLEKIKGFHENGSEQPGCKEEKVWITENL